MTVAIHHGDCRAILPTLPAESVQCVVTSPPYWGLRDYGTASWEGGEENCGHRGIEARTVSGGPGKQYTNAGSNRVFSGDCVCGARRVDSQLGLEPRPEAYVAAMVGVFREVRRVLRDDGTLWLNMGDSYATGTTAERNPTSIEGPDVPASWASRSQPIRCGTPGGFKTKDLVGMPWRLAFALQADGWYLRADIIWAKPNPMPESVTDRPTKAHEYIFLLTKSARYFYDADAVREPLQESSLERGYSYRDPEHVSPKMLAADSTVRANGTWHGKRYIPTGRNLRSVWTIPSAPFPDAHFATFPPALASRCIQAGTSEKGCCRACGAPWERQVETYGETPREKAESIGFSPKANGTGGRPQGLHYTGHQVADRPRITAGWQPSCACDAPAIPCTVLDPFGGSGTVGAVAEQLGRHSILVELSPEYVRMAERRTAQRGLFAQEALEA